MEREFKISEWINDQVRSNMKLWAGSIQRFYPEHLEVWTNPQKFVHSLHHEWNLLDAAKIVDWQELLKGNSNATVLDLGCGTGWLSSYLSNVDQIAQIDCLDADENNLRNMMPQVFELLKGNIGKVNPVLGLFTPILRPDHHYDMIVASSAIHHSENIVLLLSELKRVIKPEGKIVLLNETPYSTLGYMRILSRIMANVVYRSYFSSKLEYSQLVSSRGVLYDPYLGDWAMSLSLWVRMFQIVGLGHSIVNTHMFPYKRRDNQKVPLVHFICHQ